MYLLLILLDFTVDINLVLFRCSAESLAPPSMSGMDWSSLERKLEQAAEEEAKRKVRRCHFCDDGSILAIMFDSENGPRSLCGLNVEQWVE